MSRMQIEAEDALFGSQTIVSNVAFAADESGEDCAVLFAAVCGGARLIEKLGATEAGHAVDGYGEHRSLAAGHAGLGGDRLH